MRGWGKCFKVTLHKCAPESVNACQWGAERHRQACRDREQANDIFYFR
jgi:hypothetical protein